MKHLLFLGAFAALVNSAGCSSSNEGGNSGNTDSKSTTQAEQPAKKGDVDLSKYHHATFAGGCFWCEEAIFESIKGVAEVVSGYSGGKTQNPTYEEVGTGTTGHAEAIEVYYDSSEISFPSLVTIFTESIDPYQVNGQGPDHGSQYRSIIFYRNEAERALAQKGIDHLNGANQRKVAIEILPFQKFWDAEDYHQDYVPNHPENPYVQHESIPRLKRTQAKVLEWVKEDKLRK